jgi:hypothetical protein
MAIMVVPFFGGFVRSPSAGGLPFGQQAAQQARVGMIAGHAECVAIERIELR